MNTWAYTVTSAFTNSVFEAGTGTPIETPTNVSWGAANGPRSSIGVVNTPTSGLIDTNGDIESADDYFHNNNRLPLGTASLLSTRLTVTINLTPVDPAGSPLSPALSPTDVAMMR